MMWGYGYGPGWMVYGGGFVMLLFMLLLVAGIVTLSVSLTKRDRYADTAEGRRAGLLLLEERYAKGEIQRDEYLQKRQDLLAGS